MSKEARNQRYYLRHRERILADNLAAYRDSPESKRENIKQWRTDNPHKYAFQVAKYDAQRTGVEFDITLEEFSAIWGDDVTFRGRSAASLAMFRFADSGAIAADNVYIATLSEHTAGART